MKLTRFKNETSGKNASAASKLIQFCIMLIFRSRNIYTNLDICMLWIVNEATADVSTLVNDHRAGKVQEIVEVRWHLLRLSRLVLLHRRRIRYFYRNFKNRNVNRITRQNFCFTLLQCKLFLFLADPATNVVIMTEKSTVSGNSN